LARKVADIEIALDEMRAAIRERYPKKDYDHHKVP
jgi:hypothetical protein